MLRRQLDVRGELVEAPVSFAERWWNERPVNMDLISSLPKQNHEISLEEFENLRTKAVEDSLHLRSKLPRPENFIVLRLEPQSALQASTVGADFFFNRALLSSLRILCLVHYILYARILFLLKEP